MDYSYDMGEVPVTHAQFQIVGRNFAVSSRYVVRIGHALFLRPRSSFVVKNSLSPKAIFRDSNQSNTAPSDNSAMSAHACMHDTRYRTI